MKKTLLMLLFLLPLLIISNSCEELTSIDKSSTDEIPFDMIEPYLVPPTGMIGDWKQMDLKTIKVWEGTESKEITFQADKTPWVLNAGYKATSKISTNFEVNVWQDLKDYPSLRKGFYTQTTRTGLSTVLVEEKGKYTIEVKASGCSWWVKIGVEP